MFGMTSFPRRILLDEVFICRVFEASFGVRANLPNRGFTVAILRHFVEEQLQRRQRHLTRGYGSDDREGRVFRKGIEDPPSSS
jgi:hypothetical protein